MSAVDGTADSPPTLITPRLAQVAINVGPDGELHIVSGWFSMNGDKRESVGIPALPVQKWPRTWARLEPHIRDFIEAVRRDTGWSITGEVEEIDVVDEAED